VAHWEREKWNMLSGRGRSIAAGQPSSAGLAGGHQSTYWRTLADGDYAGAMGYQDLMIRLPELLLMRVDKMTMLSSVEARVPFLDHRVVEMAFSIPQDFKIRGGRTKHILKEAAGPLLGSDIIDRPKVGFDVPLSSWLREPELGGWAETTVMESKLHQRDLFDRDALRHLFRSHAAGKADFGYRIWNLVNLSAWYDHWVA